MARFHDPEHMSRNCALGDIIEYIAERSGEGGTCTTPQGRAYVLKQVNQAIPILLRRIDAAGSLWSWRVTLRSQTFTLPADCLEPRQVWLNGCAIGQRDEFYQGQLGVGQCSGAPWVCAGAQLIDLGDGFALPYDWPDHHKDTRYGLTAESDDDAGKTVHLRLKNQHGDTVDEDLVLLPDQQMAVTVNVVTDVLYQNKGQTTGSIRGSVVYPQLGSTAWIGTFAPQVIAPTYRKKKIPMCYPCGTCPTLEVLGKLRFYPIRTELDPLPICNEEALGFAVQALFESRNNRFEDADAALGRALQSLDFENMTAQELRQLGPKCRFLPCSGVTDSVTDGDEIHKSQSL